MKNSQSIRKILFISQSKVALVVFNLVEDQKNVLFADQIEINGAETRVIINDLLSKATNFLGFAIKEVEVVFDDSNVQKIACNEEFVDCFNEDEITKAVYKFAKAKNLYVNEVTYNNIIYDDIEKKAIVNYEIVASQYLTYKKYINVVKECNLIVLNSTNIYSLLNNKKASSQIVIRLLGKSTTVSEYALAKLSNVVNYELKLDEVYAALANRFEQSVDSIKQMINIVNNIEADLESETLVALSFDFPHRRFNGLKANEFIEAYQAEINYLLSNKFNLNDYSEVTIITNEAINKLANAKVQKVDSIIGLDHLDDDKLLALANIDTNAKKNSQFMFENSFTSKTRSLAA